MSAEDIEYMDDYKEFPTKESALDWLDNYLSLDERNNLIRALEQEPCEDCVSRQAVLDSIEDDNRNGNYSCFASNNDAQCFKNVIRELPPVIPQPKMGRWLHRENMDYLDKNKVRHNHFMCQDCGFIHDFVDGHTTQYKYCPSCGAKMQEDEE